MIHLHKAKAQWDFSTFNEFYAHLVSLWKTYRSDRLPNRSSVQSLIRKYRRVHPGRKSFSSWLPEGYQFSVGDLTDAPVTQCCVSVRHLYADQSVYVVDLKERTYSAHTTLSEASRVISCSNGNLSRSLHYGIALKKGRYLVVRTEHECVRALADHPEPIARPCRVLGRILIKDSSQAVVSQHETAQSCAAQYHLPLRTVRSKLSLVMLPGGSIPLSKTLGLWMYPEFVG